MSLPWLAGLEGEARLETFRFRRERFALSRAKRFDYRRRGAGLASDGAWVATIKDVAKRAGVAISTVSAVINRSAPASGAVIERVERAIAEIGYIPHQPAQTLRSGQSRIIGLILPDITNPHFSTVARVVEKACIAAGYMTFVYNTGEDSDHEMQILKMMRMQRVAGLLLIPTRSDAAHGARLMAEIKVPTVLLDAEVEDVPFDTVCLDNVLAGRLAIEYLLGLGHRRLTVVSGREGVSTAEQRLEGCRLALAAAGLSLTAEMIVEGSFSEERAYASARRILAKRKRPSAIFALSNLMTIGVIRGLASRELQSPRDVSIIGIDDFDWAEIMNPRPCVIAQPVARMAETAIATLLEQITSGRKPSGQRLRFPPKLVIRGSCAAIGQR
jgi:DNA-binding LacI/PurR family transcriptional regulator